MVQAEEVPQHSKHESRDPLARSVGLPPLQPGEHRKDLTEQVWTEPLEKVEIRTQDLPKGVQAAEPELKLSSESDRRPTPCVPQLPRDAAPPLPSSFYRRTPCCFALLKVEWLYRCFTRGERTATA